MSWPKLLRPDDVVALCPAITRRTLKYWIAQAKPKVAHRSGKRVEIPGNGLEPALIRKGRVTLIDEAKFLAWLKPHESLPREGGEK